jgi:hypothetical protein
MSHFKNLMAAGVALFALTSAANAADCPGPNPCPPNSILNGQLSIGTTISNVQTHISDINGKVSATSAAIGNSLSVDVSGDTLVGNTQQNYGYVGATLNATVARTKDVSLTAAAIGNSASIKTTGSDTLELNNLQIQAWDPSATVAAAVTDINGPASITAAAIANSLSVETDAALIRVGTTQRNQGPNVANVNATVARVAGDVSVTSAAIANSVSIKTGL